MRWKKISSNGIVLHEELQKLGCKHPGDTKWFSYYCTYVGEIRLQPCVGLYQSIRPRASIKYNHVQHYTIEKSCDYAQEVLCVRTPKGFTKFVIVTKHEMGKCPVCKYHTCEEHTTQMREELRKYESNQTQ